MQKEPALGFQMRNYLSFSDHALLEQTVQELFIGASDSGIKGQQNHMEKLIWTLAPLPSSQQQNSGVISGNGSVMKISAAAETGLV